MMRRQKALTKVSASGVVVLFPSTSLVC